MDKDNKQELFDCLLKWLQNLSDENKSATAQSLNDGWILARTLNQIDSEYFTDNWLAKIKRDVGDNWRLKVSNLKKVVDAIFNFYSDVLGNSSLPDDLRPDSQKIAEKSSTIELGRLLQLVLGCAVNCAEKQAYITQIMELEVSLQKSIMNALTEMDYLIGGMSSSRNSLVLGGDVKQLQEERDQLAQKCHDSDAQIAMLLEEKQNLLHELGKMQELVDRYENPNTTIGDDGTSIGPIQAGSARYNDIRKQLAEFKDELLQAETAKDDLKMKTIQQEKEIIILHAKIEDLQHQASEVAQLRDENDALRESNEKLKICETQLTTFKKKLEDYNDLKKQVKVLEERSAEYLKQNLAYEEDAKRYLTLKGQVELYKKEIEDLHSKYDTEMTRTTKTEFETHQLQSRVAALQREKESLIAERDELLERLDEIKCARNSESPCNPVSSELQSPEMKERLARLEAEAKALREGQGGQAALAQLLNDANQRADKLREQLKEANQRIFEMEQAPKPAAVAAEDSSPQANGQNAALAARISQLETALSAKNAEHATLETRYKKCVEKAKEVIKAMDPTMAAGEAALLEKRLGISGGAGGEVEAQSTMDPVEERLIVSAFYALGMNCQREAVDARLALLNSPGQSFLGRQRQPAPRKNTAFVNYNKKS